MTTDSSGFGPVERQDGIQETSLLGNLAIQAMQAAIATNHALGGHNLSIIFETDLKNQVVSMTINSSPQEQGVLMAAPDNCG